MRYAFGACFAAFFAILASTTSVACGPHQDVTPQIEVSPNVAGRYHLMPGHASQTEEDLPSGQHEEVAPSFVRELADANAASQVSSVARAGDFVLGNAEIVLVLRGKAGEGFSLVDVVDAASKSGAKSGLDGIAFGSLVSKDSSRATFVVDKVATFTTPDEGAAVLARGHIGKLAAETTLRLAKTDRAALVTTTITDETSEKQGPFDVVDDIHWGDAKPITSGRVTPSTAKDSGAREVKGSYLGAVGSVASYAITSTTGEIDATVTGKDAVLHLDRALSIDPHSQKSLDRVLVVGGRADSSSLVAELVRASGGALGRITLSVSSTSNRTPPLDYPAMLILRTAGGEDALTIALARENTVFVDLPPGPFTVRSASQDPVMGAHFLVRAGDNVPVELAVP